MNKVLGFLLILACVAASFSLEAAWTYNETTWDNKGIGSGTISDGKWTLSAMRIAKNSMNLRVYAEKDKAVGPSELSPMDFSKIEGDFKVVEISVMFKKDILGDWKEFISELIAPDCTVLSADNGYGFGYCSSLTNVVLNSELSTLKSKAFVDCSGLVKFYPNELKVTSLPYMAFTNCKKLTGDFTFENLVSIDERAFDACYSLKSITAPKLEKISAKGFLNCTNLLYVKSESLKSLGALAFSGCTALDFDLKDILGPSLEFLGNTNKNVKAISESFLGCSSLKGPLVWDFPNLNPNIVHTNCFKGCTSLSSVVFKTPVEEIQNGAFLSIAPGAQLFMHKEPPKMFSAQAIGNKEGPYPKIYIGGDTYDDWLEAIRADNCMILKGDFNKWEGTIGGKSISWKKVAELMESDSAMCSVAGDNTVAVIGEEKRHVQAFVISADKKSNLYGFWVIKNPDSGLRVSIR